LRVPPRTRKEPERILLTKNRRLSLSGQASGSKADLLEPVVESTEDAQRLVLVPQGVERKHRRSLSSLREPVDPLSGLGVKQCPTEIALSERRVGRIEISAECPGAIGAAQGFCPWAVRLVLEHIAANERQRLFE
jgi:hypothetical protein